MHDGQPRINQSINGCKIQSITATNFPNQSINACKIQSIIATNFPNQSINACKIQSITATNFPNQSINACKIQSIIATNFPNQSINACKIQSIIATNFPNQSINACKIQSIIATNFPNQSINACKIQSITATNFPNQSINACKIQSITAAHFPNQSINASLLEWLDWRSFQPYFWSTKREWRWLLFHKSTRYFSLFRLVAWFLESGLTRVRGLLLSHSCAYSVSFSTCMGSMVKPMSRRSTPWSSYSTSEREKCSKREMGLKRLLARLLSYRP